MPLHKSKILLPKLIEASYALSNIIVASENRHEDFSKSYKKDKEAFSQLIASGIKLERLLKKYFRDLSVQIPNEIDWSNYSHKVLVGAEPTLPLILYRGGQNVSASNLYTPNPDAFGISTSQNPMTAKAFAKAAGNKDVAEITLSQTAKIKIVDTAGGGIDSVYNYEQLQKLYSQGYDAVQDISSTLEQEVRILNPGVIQAARIINVDSVVPSINDITTSIDWDGKLLNLQIVFNEGSQGSFSAGMSAAHAEVGVKTQILPSDAPAIKALRQYGLDRAKLIESSTKDRVKESLVTSLRNGLNVQQAADALADILDDPSRAAMIARTEQVLAYSEGRQAVGDELGAKYKIWDNGQPKACPSCQGLHGTKVKWDAMFPGGEYDDVDYPPLHPNCYCGWHMVL